MGILEGPDLGKGNRWRSCFCLIATRGSDRSGSPIVPRGATSGGEFQNETKLNQSIILNAQAGDMLWRRTGGGGSWVGDYVFPLMSAYEADSRRV